MKTAPPVAFLGVCNRAAQVHDPGTGLPIWNALGIRTIVGAYIYPLALTGWSFLFALYDPQDREDFNIVIKDDRGEQISSVHLTLEAVKQSEDREHRAPGLRDSSITTPSGWTLSIAPSDRIRFMPPRPGLYTFYVVDTDGESAIGSIHFGLLPVPPLTTERIAAIRSDPGATKIVRIEAACVTCQDKIGVYAAFERSSSTSVSGYQWYADVPDEFRCKCGLFIVDLRIIRTNLPALLGAPVPGDGALSFIPLYQRAGIETMQRGLADLLDRCTREEDIQVFFDENPLTLHCCAPSADKIIAKASVLTRHKTDFAILSSRRELILVELERADTRLLTNKGGVAGPLQHALDQVNDWLQLADDQRGAFLDSLDIDPSLVASVRGVVIAGRDNPYQVRHLRSLKGKDFGRVTFFTYDDVCAALGQLAKRVASL